MEAAKRAGLKDPISYLNVDHRRTNHLKVDGKYPEEYRSVLVTNRGMKFMSKKAKKKGGK